MERTVQIFDTTLRDGEQTPGVHLTAEHKVAIATRLEAFGVATIEAGFPASSPGDEAAVDRVAATVRRCEVAALARCVPGDIEAAARALERARRPVAHVFLGTSEVHLRTKLRMSRADALRAIRASVRAAASRFPVVQFSAEDASRTERSFLRQCMATAVEAGAVRINLPDTVGAMTPDEYGALIADAVAFVGPDIIVSAHCHNDMGLATANAVAAVQGGARQVEGTINGIGERAGNSAIEEVGVVLALKHIARTGLHLDHITALSAHVADITGVPIQPNRAVVGANAFAHSSGIHQDGILKQPENYEFVPPALVGASGHRFVLTARSGRNAIAHEARQLGFELSADGIQAVYGAFVAAADAAQGPVSVEELRAIIAEVCGSDRPAAETPAPPRSRRSMADMFCL